MEKTTRALAVLAASVLVLAPIVNGVLQEAAATADRVFLKETDWTREPPEDPPEGEPPEDLNRSDLEGNLTGPGGARPSCTIREQVGAFWRHEQRGNGTAAVSNRSTDPTQQSFEIGDRDIGIGVRLLAENVTGSFSAYVYQEGQQENPVFAVEKQSNPLPETIQERSTTRRPELANGTWIAELNYQGASYERLQFVVVIAHCVEASS